MVVAPLTGTTQTRALADALDGRRVASVFSPDDGGAAPRAEAVAVQLGVPLRSCTPLREARAGESPVEVIARHRALFEEIADLHRGETVLVLGHASALRLVVPALVDGAPAPTGAVELEADADGWVLSRQGP